MSILCLACTRAQIWLSTAHQDQRMSIVGPFLPLSQKKCLSFQLLVFHFHFSPVFPSLSSDERRQGNKIKLVLRSNMQLSTCRQRRQVKQENGCTILASTICIFHCTPPPNPQSVAFAWCRFSSFALKFNKFFQQQILRNAKPGQTTYRPEQDQP